MKNKNLTTYLALAMFFVLSLAVIAIAAVDQTGYLAKDRTINDDFITAYSSVDVQGTVNGDVIMSGGTVNFGGKSTGDVLAAGGNLTIAGDVGGNVRAAGGNLVLDGKVGKNVSIAGGNLVLGGNSTVAGNMYTAGGMTEIRGTVEKNLKVASGSVVISGTVNGDAEIMAEDIVTRPGAKIRGNLTYYADRDLNIDKSIVGGQVVRKNPPAGPSLKPETLAGSFLAAGIIKFLSILILALVFYRLFAASAMAIFLSLRERDSWKMIGVGILAVILIPILAVILAITVIGLPLAIILFFIFVAACLLAQVVASIALGHLINNRMKPHEDRERFPWGDFIVGYVILEVLTLIPFIGSFLSLLVFLWAFGGLMKHFYMRMMGMRRRETTVMAPPSQPI